MRVKLTIQYLGTNYSGWQTQNSADSVQAQIEDAIFKLTKERVTVHASGRTDKGVHAWAQIAHFDTNAKIPAQNFYKAINQYLPQDIRILKSQKVSDSFHARFNAKRKTYEYSFYVSETPLPMLNAAYAHIRRPFDLKKAQMCICAFEGTHDFRAFMSAGSKYDEKTKDKKGQSVPEHSESAVMGLQMLTCVCRPETHSCVESGRKHLPAQDASQTSSQAGQAYVRDDKTPTTRTIYSCRLKKGKYKDSYVLTVTGSGFLYNMVRIIAGTVIEVGAGKIAPQEVPKIIAGLDRKRAGATAPANGLALKQVIY